MCYPFVVGAADAWLLWLPGGCNCVMRRQPDGQTSRYVAWWIGDKWGTLRYFVPDTPPANLQLGCGLMMTPRMLNNQDTHDDKREADMRDLSNLASLSTGACSILRQCIPRVESVFIRTAPNKVDDLAKLDDAYAREMSQSEIYLSSPHCALTSGRRGRRTYCFSNKGVPTHRALAAALGITSLSLVWED